MRVDCRKGRKDGMLKVRRFRHLRLGKEGGDEEGLRCHPLEGPTLACHPVRLVE